MYGVTEVDGILGDLGVSLISLMLQNVVFPPEVMHL
jgi:16S rRNA C1402 N4-methylase RsmH